MLGGLDLEAADPHPAPVHAAVEQVHAAEEVVDERAGRLVVDRLGRADLLDAPAVHHHDAIGHLERLVLVVGDEHAGDLELVVQPPQPAAQLLADLGVERAEGLVQQQHARLDGERAGERDALALAAGELRGVAVRDPVELHELEQLLHARLDLALGRPQPPRPHAEPEGDVLEHRHVAEERVVLEHEADAAVADVLRRGILVVEQDGPRVGDLEARDDPQQRRLAGARRPDQRDELPARHVEGDVVEGGKGAEALGDVSNRDAHVATVLISAARPPRASR